MRRGFVLIALSGSERRIGRFIGQQILLSCPPGLGLIHRSVHVDGELWDVFYQLVEEELPRRDMNGPYPSHELAESHRQDIAGYEMVVQSYLRRRQASE